MNRLPKTVPKEYPYTKSTLSSDEVYQCNQNLTSVSQQIVHHAAMPLTGAIPSAFMAHGGVTENPITHTH